MTTRHATISTLCILATLAGCGSDSAAGPAAPVGMTPTSPTAPMPGAPVMPAPTGAAGSGATSTPTASSTPTTAGSSTPASGASMTPTASSTPMTTPPASMTPTASSTPAAGAAGSGAAPTMPPAAAGPVDPRGKCTIMSGYPDDNACLLAPKPEEGMQIHVGPSDYTNMAEVAKYIQMPGDESSECWTFHTPNTEEFYYQTFELSGRAGTHHIINTMYNVEIADGGFGTCADPGTGTNGNIIDNLPGASKAYMVRTKVAPENEHVGRKIPAKVTSQADMHYYNFTEKPILREFWMNIFSTPKANIQKEAAQIRGMGGLSWSIAPIQPGTDMTYKYECPITGNGRILSLLGHYHSHGKQFTASIRRAGGQVEKVFEMFDYKDPATFEYDTINKNPAFATGTAGATSGMLEVKSGDTLLWDCHVVNDGTVALTYTNEVKTGEMCNLWGSSLDIPELNCVIP